ncbi:MAG: hypothetical protein HZB26_20770 [Candidatus Hydrogenedentes bacterium]|nr:hypothetical protein [Candidatus Hydrogenedentota bacterium]
MLRRLVFAAVLLSVFAPAFRAAAAAPRFAEKGRDVGDGQVLYDIPYDPKALAAVTFVYPTVNHPFYEIVVPMGDWSEGTSAAVQKVRVNGIDCDSYYIFVDGFSHVQSGWITKKAAAAKNVVLVARALWHSGESVSIEADITTTPAEGATKTITKTFSATAPAYGGGPVGWRRYQSLLLTEPAGIARVHEPVEFSLTVRAEDCADLEKELRLFVVDSPSGALQPLPLQTFNAKSFAGTPPGTSNANYLQHPSKSLEAVFLASVPANASRVYVFAYDNPAAPAPEAPQTDLVVEGPALGAKVENRFFTVDLDDRSGQIASVDMKGRPNNPVPRLTNSYSNAVHWNPDSFSDNGKWGHTFSWNPPDETVVSARGPLMFRVTNAGRMPEWTPQVHASVTYTFYAGVPYVKAVNVNEVREDTNISAIRNGEIVLDSGLVTNFVWKEKNGKTKIIRTGHGPNWQDEWGVRVDQDVPWLAMTNEPGAFGIGEVVTNSLAYSQRRGEATTHRPAFYLYAHHFWTIPVTYCTRAWVYPFSDYQRGPILPVDEGSTYVEKLAFVPFYLEKGSRRYQEIETISEQLHHPLQQRWGR